MADIHDIKGSLLEKGADDLALAEQVRRLLQAGEYQKRPPPVPGALVTVTQGLVYYGELIKVQTPMLVINVVGDDKLGTCDFANVRVAYVCRHPEVGTFLRLMWLEHWCLEPYVREGE